ncbi:hypothetical protein C8R43DRAFT_1187967 [Mycena crocata]|nr:hypothetical protein C8R43DRAFT_1187967 [Mycena crocata]
MNFPRQTGSINATAGESLSAAPISSAASAVQSGSQGRADSSDSAVASDVDGQPSGSAASASASKSASAPPSSSARSDPPASGSNSQSASVSESSAPPQSSGSAPPPSSESQQPSSESAPPPSSTSESITPLPESLSASITDSASGSTTSFTTLTTSVDGTLTTVHPISLFFFSLTHALLQITSAIPPTSLATGGSSAGTARRTAIIAGATAAGVGVILLLLGGLFVYKRHKGRKREFSEAIGRVRREAHGAGGVGLLDSEGFDDEDLPMRRYQDNPITHARSRSMNTSATSLGPPQSPAPSLFRQRAETGSLFREEGVWPPPQGAHFVDPLVGVGNLGNIVDDVMGPAHTSSHGQDASGSSSAALMPPAYAVGDPAHRGNIPSMSSATSLYADPFRDISHVPAPSDPSLYYDRRGASSSMSSNSQFTSSSRPTTPQSLLGLPAGAAGTPKKPSPLAAAANPPSSATWLTRSPKKHGLSGSQSSHEA